MSELENLKKKPSITDLEYAVVHYAIFGGDSHSKIAERASRELAALRARVAELEQDNAHKATRVKSLETHILVAQSELRSTQRNWDEDCLFFCDAELTAAMRKGE